MTPLERLHAAREMGRKAFRSQEFTPGEEMEKLAADDPSREEVWYDAWNVGWHEEYFKSSFCKIITAGIP